MDAFGSKTWKMESEACERADSTIHAKELLGISLKLKSARARATWTTKILKEKRLQANIFDTEEHAKQYRDMESAILAADVSISEASFLHHMYRDARTSKDVRRASVEKIVARLHGKNCQNEKECIYKAVWEKALEFIL